MNINACYMFVFVKLFKTQSIISLPCLNYASFDVHHKESSKTHRTSSQVFHEDRKKRTFCQTRLSFLQLWDGQTVTATVQYVSFSASTNCKWATQKSSQLWISKTNSSCIRTRKSGIMSLCHGLLTKCRQEAENEIKQDKMEMDWNRHGG